MFPAPPLQPGRDLNDIARWEQQQQHAVGSLSTASAPRSTKEIIDIKAIFLRLAAQQESVDEKIAASSVPVAINESIEVEDDPPAEPAPKAKKKRVSSKSKARAAVDNKTCTDF